MIYQALDILNILEGIIGMFAIYIVGIYLHKGIKETHKL